MSLNVDALIFICAFIGLAWALFNYFLISKIKIDGSNEGSPLAHHDNECLTKHPRLIEVYEAISEGARAFLHAEYTIVSIFMAIFAVVIFILVSLGSTWSDGALTTLSFALGAATSITSGYIGMKVAVYSNVRTTICAARSGWKDCFNTAFRAGAVMGFALTGLGVLVLYITLLFYKIHYGDDWTGLTDAISGYGLGGSSIALFGRVGGGIYTKAADVGADLVGKVEHGIPEDSPRNPATIADNVGDNVGDVAGMGADLFGSFAESTCAALVIAASSDSIVSAGWSALVFPICISAVGIIICLLCSFIATDFSPVHQESHIENVLKVQIVSTALLMLPPIYGLAVALLPSNFTFNKVSGGIISCTPSDAFICVLAGTIGGMLIGVITEYYTSHSYNPVREIANNCKTGAATNVIAGLALGYKSAIIPVFVLAAVIYTAFSLCDLYGVALSAIGMLSTLATGLAIDAYGPVCDNAGGIAEMSELEPEVREKTDALDAAGNTTAAIGKGFAIGSAALVSLALYGAFVTRLGIDTGVNILEPLTFAFLLIGAMLPYWFSAMTMRSVGLAATEMVQEVQRQYREKPYLLDENSNERPDYDKCIEISTRASLREMVYPGALVIFAPILAGIFFGVNSVFGILTGGLVSGVQLAISMSNTGGAWDNAKKYIEKHGPESDYKGKGSDIHKAAVVGDTVGDPLKDTSGPSLNILMKLMAILSLVFADFFNSINGGSGLFKTS